MMTIERLWTVRDVMDVLPYGKTKVTSIINSLPHINEGKKLLVDPREIHAWILRKTAEGCQHVGGSKLKRPRKAASDGLTPDGLIPYRHKK